VRERFDPFQGTSKERVARKYRVTGVDVHAARRAAERPGAPGRPSQESGRMEEEGAR
jgi:hypothetical protein